MKVEITGASHFVNRMYEACGPYQWAREMLKNSLEAGAKRVEFGIEWQAVAKLGVYRRTVMDDGRGMDHDELLHFFSTLGSGAKKIGGIHDNFGVGARIATLPWNPNGVVVLSYKNGRGALIWILQNPDTGDYELVEFESARGKACVIDPDAVGFGGEDGIDWGAIKPKWIREHGTIVVLLGSDEYPDTVLGNSAAEEREIKGISVYLNSRFWDLTKQDVTVVEVRSDKKPRWPESPDDEDDARRPNNRKILGARHYLVDVKGTEGEYLDGGVVPLQSGRVPAEWYLWKGERPHVDSYAKKQGYIALRYKYELFELTSSKVFFRSFGITESKVQQNLTIILEPQLYEAGNGRWGVHADQSRNRLIFTGGGEKGVAIPLTDWGVEFAYAMPELIKKAIHEARGEGSGSIEDEDYRKRLQDKFGSRWMVRALAVAAKAERAPTTEAGATGEQMPMIDFGEGTKTTKERKKRKPTSKVVYEKAGPGTGAGAVERDVPVDVPKYRFAPKEDFEQPWHLASWAPQEVDGPTVFLNVESPILDEVVRHHQAQYPDVFAEEVANTVRHTFGEIAACKIAHSQQLAKKIPEEELNGLYRSEAALTVSLMGLLAEDSVIAVRLGKLGSKKRAPAPPAPA